MTETDNVGELQKQITQLRGDLLTVATRVGHDLRTPLGGILSSAEALRELSGQPSSANRALLDSLIVSADEMSRMIKDVSFVLKATANPQPKEMLKMEGVVACALQRSEYQVVKSGAKINQPSDWPQVRGVAQWLEKIWSILLEYALQRGGDSPMIELGWRASAGEKLFWLRDGMQIPSEQQSLLFQSFDSLHELNSAGGLNFAIARRLVELQKGRCGCDAGSSIFFTLPD